METQPQQPQSRPRHSSPSVRPEVEGHKTTNPNLTTYPNAATKTTPARQETPPSYNPCRLATPKITPKTAPPSYAMRPIRPS